MTDRPKRNYFAKPHLVIKAKRGTHWGVPLGRGTSWVSCLGNLHGLAGCEKVDAIDVARFGDLAVDGIHADLGSRLEVVQEHPVLLLATAGARLGVAHEVGLALRGEGDGVSAQHLRGETALASVTEAFLPEGQGDFDQLLGIGHRDDSFRPETIP